MKRFIEFIKQPYTTALLCAIGLVAGFVGGVLIKFLLDTQIIFNHKKVACQQAFETMCLQVHACTGSSVESCDNIVKENNMCDVSLPDLQVIQNCKQELRHIECTDDMPVSCIMFME